jgi:hypothetical protein
MGYHHTMASLIKSNPYLRKAKTRQAMLWHSVLDTSAFEGIRGSTQKVNYRRRALSNARLTAAAKTRIKGS